MLAMLFAGGFGVATVLGDWHRPSDTLAAFLIALAWACLAAIAIKPRDPVQGRALPGRRAVRLGSGVASTLLLCWVVLLATLFAEFELGDSRLMSHAELLAALGLIAVSLIAALTCQAGEAISEQASEEAQKQTGPKPYAEVITDQAKSQQGLFTIHSIGDQTYAEIPAAMLGREMLWNAEVVKLIGGVVEDRALAGRGGRRYTPVPADEQRRWPKIF